MALSVLIPAHNEAGYISPCLAALAAQDIDALPDRRQIIVAANACQDSTVAEARAMAPALAAQGWHLEVLDLPDPGKPQALNQAESRAAQGHRVYLDADVICAPAMMAALVRALDTDAPRYASGQLQVPRAQSWVSRRYAALWTRLPFMTARTQGNVPGAGLFAVNPAGRARWEAFPDIIADDAFVRLCFAPQERVQVPVAYAWPVVEGFGALVRVRRRQDAGMRELAARFPDLMANESTPPLRARDHLGLMLRWPISYAVYVTIRLLARRGGQTGWSRGR